jgi:glucose/mannose-6-phosphate isomerase
VNGSILTKIINLNYLLNYSSMYASILNKTDPTPVKSIEDVKKNYKFKV